MSESQELETAKNRHEANLRAIQELHRQSIATSDANYSNAEIDYNATRISVGRREATYARWWIYWPFLIGLAWVEVPVNQLAFQLYFGEGSSVSIIITAAIGVVLITLAHWLGTTMRRFRHNSQYSGGVVASMAWVIFLTLLLLALSYSLAVLRQGYLAFQRAPIPTLSDLAAQGRPVDAAAEALGRGLLHFALELDGWAFFFFNIGILTVGILGAFWSHDPHPDYARQHQAKLRTWRVLQRAQEGRDLAAEEADYAAREDQIRSRYVGEGDLPRLPPPN